MDKCFCHLNGYAVKDAEARKKLDGTLPMGDIKVSSIKGKNLFNINKEYYYGSATTKTVDNNTLTITGKWYIHQLYNIKPNTDYHLSFEKEIIEQAPNSGLVRIYNGTNMNNILLQSMSSSFSFNTGNNTKIGILFFSCSDGENIGSIKLSNIQLEEGLEATEYAPYFELATKEELESVNSKGYYHYEMELPALVYGKDYEYSNVITDENCLSVVSQLMSKIKKDNVNQFNAIIENSTSSLVVDGETIDNPYPRKINLCYMTVSEPDTNGDSYYTLSGETDYNHVQLVASDNTITSTGLEIKHGCRFHVIGHYENETFVVTSLSISLMDSEIPTKTYVDTAISNIEIPEIADLTNYATKTYVDEAIGEIEIPEIADLTNYATKTYVDEAIGEIEIPEGTGECDALPHNYNTCVPYSLTIPSGSGSGVGSYFNGFGYLSGGIFIDYLKAMFEWFCQDKLTGKKALIIISDGSDSNFSGFGIVKDGWSLSSFKKSNYKSFTILITSVVNPGYYSVITGQAKYVDDWLFNNVAITRYGLLDAYSTLIHTENIGNYALQTTNTSEYTPTSDYHPATKKYVDDSNAVVDLTDTLSLVKEIDGSTLTTNVKFVRSGNTYFLSGKISFSTGLTHASFLDVNKEYLPLIDGSCHMTFLAHDNYQNIVKCTLSYNSGDTSNLGMLNFISDEEILLLYFTATWVK